jgi:hypothetical protein
MSMNLGTSTLPRTKERRKTDKFKSD